MRLIPVRSRDLTLVAEYNRMSTNPQDCSIALQQDWNRTYAARHGMKVVRSYVDEGRSGVTARRRRALAQLLNDVHDNSTPWSAILVYDVARWGRFQDPDEAAFYEWGCKAAGHPVIYTAESFMAIKGPLGAIPKSVKRVMSGEYSRELSVKTFAAHAALAKRGQWCGSTLAYGYRRAIVAGDGSVMRTLPVGEWKAGHDQVRVSLGSSEEVETVREVFRLFIEDGLSSHRIAEVLTARGIPGPSGRGWHSSGVRYMLHNERYTGTSIWGQRSSRLHTRVVQRPANEWIRVPNAFPAIIDRETFARAQWLFAHPRGQSTDEELIAGLQRLLRREPTLTNAVIDAAKDVPSLQTYKRRFGTIRAIYAAVGCEPPKFPRQNPDYRRAATKQRRILRDEVVDRVMALGASVVESGFAKHLIVNDTFRISIRTIRGRGMPGRGRRWIILRPVRGPVPNLTVIARLDRPGDHVIDYYVVPAEALVDRRDHGVTEVNGRSPLDRYRHDDLDGLAALIPASSPWLEDAVDDEPAL